jgi:hypothetical protein
MRSAPQRHQTGVWSSFRREKRRFQATRRRSARAPAPFGGRPASLLARTRDIRDFRLQTDSPIATFSFYAVNVAASIWAPAHS